MYEPYSDWRMAARRSCMTETPKRPRWSLLASAALLTGCAASPSLYTWGHYEDLIYSSYAEPGKVSPEMQVEQLEQDYQKARATNKRMHPGFHAYLGYLYVQLGKLDQGLYDIFGD